MRLRRLFVLAWLFWSLAAVAGEGGRLGHAALASAAAPRPVVEIVVAGAEPAVRVAMTSTFKRSLGRLGADVVMTEAPAIDPRDVAADEASGPAIRVWIDLSDPAAASLYVTEQQNVFSRRLPLADKSALVALDLLDVVVTSSVETVLSGRKLGVSRQDFIRSLDAPPVPPAPLAPQPPPSPSPQRPPSPQPPTPPPANEPSASAGEGRRPPVSPRPLPSQPVVVSIAAFYEGVLVAPATAIHGPGVLVDAEWRTIRVGLGVHGRLPHEVAGSEAQVRFAREGLRLSLGRTFLVGRDTVLVLALAGGADITHVQTSSAVATVRAVPPFWTAVPVVRPFVELDRRWGRFAVAVWAGVDVDLWASGYVVAGPNDRAPLWTPWRLRPVVAAILKLAL